MNQDILYQIMYPTADDESFDTSVIGPNESHPLGINVGTGRFQGSTLPTAPMDDGRIKVDVQLVIIISIIF